MAIGWATALKLIPWSDVIQATPQLVKAAKSLMDRNKEAAADAAAEAPAAPSVPSDSLTPAEAALQQQVHALEQRVAQLEASQQASAQLIEQLAQQNAQIVQTVGLLRTGAQRLQWACGLLAVAVAGLGVYVLYQ